MGVRPVMRAGYHGQGSSLLGWASRLFLFVMRTSTVRGEAVKRQISAPSSKGRWGNRWKVVVVVVVVGFGDGCSIMVYRCVGGVIISLVNVGAMFPSA